MLIPQGSAASDESPVDRFCKKWLPGVAAKRAESRLRMEMANSYRGAISGRLGRGFEQRRPIEGGTFTERLELREMQWRAEQVYANNPIGKSLLNTEVTNCVADGYDLQAKGVDTGTDGKPISAKAWNSEAQDRWETWLEEADLRGMMNASEIQRRPYRSARRDGDGGFVLTDSNGFSRLQHIPASKIQTPDEKLGDKSFNDGVELDAQQRPVAFHILDEDQWGKREFARVPANNFVYLAPELDDDLGVRGRTCYSSIFEHLDRADQYIDGVATAATMATVFGLIFKSDQNPTDFRNLKMIANANGTMQRGITLEHGSIKLVGGKDDVTQVVPQQPMQQAPEWIRTMVRILGLPFDMPLELAFHDMSTVTFASARVGLIQYYRACFARMKWYKSAWSRIYRWWASRERQRQRLGLPGAFVTPFPEKFFPHVLHARAWPYTDPVREAQADGFMRDMGWKSDQRIISERGYGDWEEVQIEQAAFEAFRRGKSLATDIHSTITRDSIRVTTPIAGTQVSDQGSIGGGGNNVKPAEGDPVQPNDNGTSDDE